MKETKNKTLLEYIIIITVITIFFILVIKLLGGTIIDTGTKIYCSISKKQYIQGETIGEGKCIDIDKVK